MTNSWFIVLEPPQAPEKATKMTIVKLIAVLRPMMSLSLLQIIMNPNMEFNLCVGAT